MNAAEQSPKFLGIEKETIKTYAKGVGLIVVGLLGISLFL